VGQGRLIFSHRANTAPGRLAVGGLRAVGARDGSDDEGWQIPDDGGGLTPMGRGLLLGDLVLWPTARAPSGVFAVRQSDGRQADNPALLHRLPSGNLTWANGALLVTTRRVMYAFVPPEWADGGAKEASARDVLRGLLAEADGHDPRRARAAWQRIGEDAALRELIVEDGDVPRRAGDVARRRLGLV